VRSRLWGVRDWHFVTISLMMMLFFWRSDMSASLKIAMRQVLVSMLGLGAFIILIQSGVLPRLLYWLP
jgi:hypothetical protein